MKGGGQQRFGVTLVQHGPQPVRDRDRVVVEEAVGDALTGLGAGQLWVDVSGRCGPDSGDAVDGDQVVPTWLIVTYLLHTTGELCLSPVGLSAVTKLAPQRYLGQMMGTWFMASALGHIIAGLLAGHLADDSDIAGMPDRFLFVFMTTTGAGLLLLCFTRPIKRLIGDIQ